MKVRKFEDQENYRLRRAVERGRGRAGNFYRGSRLNGGPEELDYGARERQGIKEPYNFYWGPSILSTALRFQKNCRIMSNKFNDIKSICHDSR